MKATHTFIYIAGLVLLLLLLGMTGAKYSSIKPDDNPFSVENFETPSVSSNEDVSSGASSLYDWGYTPIEDKEEPERRRRRCPKCDNIYIDEVNIKYPTKKMCRDCDITLNKDIDKYVLKSSIPPCPDMSQYALKSQLPPAGFNPDEWIRKSEIPPCPVCPDLTNYILRSEVPPCDAQKICPKCPECPTCPTCPPCENEGKVKIVEKIVYRDRPQLNSPLGAIWRPKLSNSNSGFISPDVPMTGNAWMARRADEIGAF